MLKKAEKIKPSQTQQIQKKTCQARNKEKKQARRNERLLKIKIEKAIQEFRSYRLKQLVYWPDNY